MELTDGQLEAVNRGNCKHIRTFVKKCLMKAGEVIVGMITLIADIISMFIPWCIYHK